MTNPFRNFWPRLELFLQTNNVDPLFILQKVAAFLLSYGVKAFACLLLCLALGIVSGLCFEFWTLILPLICPVPYTVGWFLNVGTVAFLLINVLFNYFKCVTTSHHGRSYDIVLQELAAATGFDYPQTADDMMRFERRHEQRMMEIHRGAGGRQGTAFAAVVPQGDGGLAPVNDSDDAAKEGDIGDLENGTKQQELPQSQQLNNQQPNQDQGQPKPPPAWTLFTPQEWSYDKRTKGPKPPRAHYDAVTRGLVLNMDHCK
jgi:hypothetical protein